VNRIKDIRNPLIKPSLEDQEGDGSIILRYISRRQVAKVRDQWKWILNPTQRRALVFVVLNVRVLLPRIFYPEKILLCSERKYQTKVSEAEIMSNRS
jgi:hypothetical protein